MKIYFIFILFAITANNPIHAQYSIHGKIKDAQSQQALAGASIYFNDLKAVVNSDEQGNYTMKNLKPGNYLIEINLLNYKTTIQQIQMQSDTIIDFLMLLATKELTEIIVTGVTRSTELKRSPIIIKSIDKQLLNEGSSTNLIDALKNVPGLSQITTGASISKPVIRGLGYNRIISLHNGIRQEGQQWGDEHGIEIDEYSIDRIEIIKGPGSLMYGSDGIAGVLNFISPKALPIGKTKTQIISNYQSNNQLIGYSFSHSGNKNGLQWLGRFSNKWASNYKNVYDGPVYNTGFREINGSLFLGVNKKWGHAHLNMSTYNSSANLAEGERDSLGQFITIRPDGSEMTVNSSDLSGYQIGFPHQAIHHHRISSNNYFILKSGTLHVDLGYQINLRQEFGDITNPNDIALNFNLNTINYNVRYNLANIKGWETSSGISGMQQNNQNKGLEFLIPEYNLFDIGGFVFTQKTFNRKWNFAVGIRFDNRWMHGEELILDSIGVPVNSIDSASSIKFNAFNQSYNGLSGSIGLSYQFDQNSTLKLNLSRGFRAPNIAELTSNGRHEGSFRYEYGNTELKSEISHQVDLAYFFNTDHVSFELTPFVNSISNFIYTSKLTNTIGGDSIPDPSDPAPAYQFAQGNAILYGGEIFFDFHPHPLDWLHVENSFSFVRAMQANQSDSTKFLPFIPAPKYRGEIKAALPKMGKVLSNSYIKFAIDYYFMQNQIYSAYGTETNTPAYILLSAGMGAEIKGMNRKDFMSIFISIENIGDVGYQNHLSRLKYAPQNALTGRNGVFNMGRNISLKMILNF